ncbi:MAG: recombinase family protein [Chloroflexi bacterium]|nr:recombinase family protein [Chloroflexota bacterium]
MKTEQTPLRTIGYIRVSTTDQAKHGTSLDSQRDKIRAYAKMNGLPEPVLFFSDEGISGAKEKRLGLDAMLATLKPGDVVIVTAIDRLARSLRILLKIVDEITENDYSRTFISIREGWDTQTPMGRFALQLVGAVAELEYQLIKERTSDGRARRIAEGKWASGRPKFGYIRNEDGRLVANKSQAEMVRRIFTLYSTGERLGLHRLSQRLQELAIPSPTGKLLWSESVLHRILTEPTYAKGHYYLPDKDKGGRQFPSAIEVPVLIDQNLWQAAQARMRTNQSVRKRRKRAWPLQGRAVCGKCGSGWLVNNARSGRTYFCRGRENRGRLFRETGSRCDIPRQPAEQLERAVARALAQSLSDYDNLLNAIDRSIEALRTRLREIGDEDVNRVKGRLEDIDEKIEELWDPYWDSRMSKQRLARIESKLIAEKQTLQVQIDSYGIDRLREIEETRRLLTAAKSYRQHTVLRQTRNLPVDMLVNGNFMFSPEFSVTEEEEMISRDIRKTVDDLLDHDTLRATLDALNARIVVYENHLEIDGLIRVNIDIPTADNDPHLSQPVRGLG